MKKRPLLIVVTLVVLLLVMAPVLAAFADNPADVNSGIGIYPITDLASGINGVASDRYGDKIVYEVDAGVIDNPIVLFDRNSKSTKIIGFGGDPAISGDGSCIVRQVQNDVFDNNGVPDIVMYEVATEKVTVISDNFNEKSFFGSYWADVNQDCSRIVFSSHNAYGVVPSAGEVYVYIYYVSSGYIELVSQYTSGQIMPGSYAPRISDSGRYVVWTSWDDSFNDFNGELDVFWRDLNSKVTYRMSEKSGIAGNSASWSPSVADNGQAVFVSNSSDLVSNDADGNVADVFWFDPTTQDNFLLTPGDEEHGVNIADISAYGFDIAVISGDNLAGNGPEYPTAFWYDFQDSKWMRVTFCTYNVMTMQVLADGTPSILMSATACGGYAQQAYLWTHLVDDFEFQIFIPLALREWKK